VNELQLHIPQALVMPLLPELAEYDGVTINMRLLTALPKLPTRLRCIRVMPKKAITIHRSRTQSFSSKMRDL